MLVWVPYESESEARRRLGDLPADVEIDLYTGGEPPASVDQVEFYVDPYLGAGKAVWDRLATFPKLKVVQTLTAGFEHIQPYVPAGVTLCNAAGLHDASTAEMALALSLAVGRHLDVFARNQTAGNWQFQWGNALADKRVTIIGYGHIGQAIERRLAGFEVGSITRVARTARTETNAVGEQVPVRAIDELWHGAGGQYGNVPVERQSFQPPDDRGHLLVERERSADQCRRRLDIFGSGARYLRDSVDYVLDRRS